MNFHFLKFVVLLAVIAFTGCKSRGYSVKVANESSASSNKQNRQQDWLENFDTSGDLTKDE